MCKRQKEIVCCEFSLARVSMWVGCHSADVCTPALVKESSLSCKHLVQLLLPPYAFSLQIRAELCGIKDFPRQGLTKHGLAHN